MVFENDDNVDTIVELHPYQDGWEHKAYPAFPFLSRKSTLFVYSQGISILVYSVDQCRVLVFFWAIEQGYFYTSFPPFTSFNGSSQTMIFSIREGIIFPENLTYFSRLTKALVWRSQSHTHLHIFYRMILIFYYLWSFLFLFYVLLLKTREGVVQGTITTYYLYICILVLHSLSSS